MTDFEMEEIYESLATKIDAFGKEKSDIFLAKLVLLLSKKFTNLEEIMAVSYTHLTLPTKRIV